MSGMQEGKKLKVKVDANVKGRKQKRKTRIIIENKCQR